MDGKVNAKFKIRFDDTKRLREIEEHAVKLVLAQTAPPGLPMIPDVQSAHLPQRCNRCYHATVWSPSGKPAYCGPCGILIEDEEKTFREISDLRKKAELAATKIRGRRLKEALDSGDEERILKIAGYEDDEEY